VVPDQIKRLDLTPPPKPWHKNLLEIDISAPQFKAIRDSKGGKLELKNIHLSFNGTAFPVKSGHLRGNTSLYLKRKSFNFSLNDKATFLTKELEHFYLISLSMDRNYYHNRLAFDLMHHLGLFGLFYIYTEVRINNASQGIYLLIQRPQDYAFHDLGAPVIIRRGYDDRIDKYKANKHVSKDTVKMHLKQFRSIDKVSRKYEGEAMLAALQKIMDVSMYMRWMAFNYLVQNGDYTDEVYFYVQSDKSPQTLGIIPWDYDDIFKLYPHEGKEERDQRLGDKLIFSSEEALDVRIAGDEKMYQTYTKEFLQLLDQLPNEILYETFEKIYHDLYPYFIDEAIISQSQSDAEGETDLATLQQEMASVYARLIVLKNQIRQKLEGNGNL
jgi:spore coat protein H